VVKTVGNGVEILDPSALAVPLGIADLTGLFFEMNIQVFCISEKVADDRHSGGEFVVMGKFASGGGIYSKTLYQRDGVTITGAKVGANFHITVNNPSSGDLDVFTTSKLRVLQP
jgi:hypothetical protein